MSLELAGIAVRGLSIGGIETCIDLPHFKVAFDVGRCPAEAVVRKTILFTHAHMDHMGGVAYHCATRALRGMPPPTYIVPRQNVEDFEALFDVWRRLDRSELPHTTIPLAPGEELRLRNDLVARPFASPHSAPCQGYGLWSQKEKLKPELVGRPAEELGRMRREGVEITDSVETLDVAFSGDSRVELLEREPQVRRARLLILETTFVDDRVSVEDCRAMGHLHLDELVERAHLFQNEALLLTHFSARYRPKEIVAALDARLPPDLRARVTPLLPRK